MPKRTWIDDLAKHFPTLIVVLLALFAFTLTNCTPIDGTRKTEAQKKAAFAGLWVRATDYCQYIEQKNENCIDLKSTQEPASALMSANHWKALSINEYGIVSSYISDAPLAVIEATNKSYQILKPYQSHEYKVKVNTTPELPEPTEIYLEGDFLKIAVVESGTAVPYFKVTEADAYQFSKASHP